MSRRSPEWLLIELFGHEPEPTIIARGNTTKNFVPLDAVIKSTTHRAVVSTALESIKNGTSSPQDFVQGGTRYIFLPLRDHVGHTNGALVHYGDSSIPVKNSPLAGAWYFNATTGDASGSSELSDIYRTPKPLRPKARPIHEAFERLVGNDPVATRKLIDKKPGVTHQAAETMSADDGTLWVIHYSCRFVEDPNGEILLHGITRQAGVYQAGSDAPHPFDLAHQVAAAERQPNIFRTIIDPTTGNLLRSYDPYPHHLDGIRNIFEALADRDEINMIMPLLQICAEDRAPLRDLVTVGPNGHAVDFDLLPINAAGTTAVFGVFHLSPE